MEFLEREQSFPMRQTIARQTTPSGDVRTNPESGGSPSDGSSESMVKTSEAILSL